MFDPFAEITGDPDDSELWISLVCALENLVLAAREHGLDAGVDLFPDDAREAGARVTLGAGSARPDPRLVAAIPERQTTRSRYDGAPLPPETLGALEAASAQEDVQFQLLTGRRDRERVLELLMDATTAQLADPAFRGELAAWMRFSAREVVQHQDGLTMPALGLPLMPRWLGETALRLVVSRRTHATPGFVRSASALMVFSADRDDPEAWLNVGRSFERVALRATALGVRHAHLNAVCEVPDARASLATALELGRARPMLVARIGHAPPMPRAPRRPLEMVLARVEPSAL